jgi:hypothetical protein
MDGNDASMLAAVDGSAPPVKDLPSGPPPTTTTVAPPGGSASVSPESGASSTLPDPLSSPVGSATTSVTTTTTTTPTSTTTTSQPTYFYLGDLDGTQVRLTLAGFPGLLDTQSPQSAGELTGFSTNDPAYQCLDAAAGLTVNTYANHPGLDVVVATAPANCTSAQFFFPSSVVDSG